MTGDPGDLANLRDLALPPPPPFWPPAPGIAVCLAGLCVLLAALIWHGIDHYRANAFRRVARAEIDRLGATLDERDTEAIAAVSAVLKRAALVAHPRHIAASLTGAGWSSFIANSPTERADVPDLGRLIDRAYGDRSQLSHAEFKTLIEQARRATKGRWLSRYRAGG
jgi:hypothetical protein